jgi:hypothetical protein
LFSLERIILLRILSSTGWLEFLNCDWYLELGFLTAGDTAGLSPPSENEDEFLVKD